MSIDTGQSLSYNPNFPIPNVDQSSQQFRDNFSILKTAIENIQTATNGNTSVLSISVSLLSSGAVQLNSSYPNNTLTLPIGDPTSGSPASGMIRYNSATNTVQYANAAGSWNSLLFLDSTGRLTLAYETVTTQLTLSYTPVNPTDAVNVQYVQSQANTLSNALAYESSVAAAATNAVATSLASEQSVRAAADASLQAQINNLSNYNSNSNATVSSLQSEINSLEQQLNNESNARVAGYNSQANSISTLSTNLSNNVTYTNLLASDILEEASLRQAADQNLYSIINSAVVSQSANNNTIQSEITALQIAEGNDANNIVFLSNSLANEVAARVAADSYLQSEINNLLFNDSPTISNGILYLDNTAIYANAGQYITLQTEPNADGGFGDSAFIVYDQNNFQYALTDATYQALINASLVANGLSNTNSLFEYSCLRIGTTNDHADGQADDSIALEPAAHLWLNPGWEGVENDPGGQSFPEYANGAISVGISTLSGDSPAGRVPNTVNASVFVGNASSYVIRMRRDTGDITTTGSITAQGDISALSDQSLKDNVRTIDNALELVSQLRGVTYQRNDYDGREQIGVIAQEVQQVVPQVVSTHSENGLLTVSYGNLSALFIEAIKDMKAKIESLEVEIASLKNQKD